MYEIFVAFRILRARKRQAVSVMTGISVAGIILGVAALVIVLGITGGFQDAFRDRILGLHPHLIVYRTAGDAELQSPDTFFDYREVAHEILQVDGVKGVSPSTYHEMLIARGPNRAGVSLKGVDIQSVETVIPVAAALIEGTLSTLEEKPTVLAKGDRVVVENPVIGSSWTMVAFSGDSGEDAFHMVRDRGEAPLPGQPFLRVLHLAEHMGDMHVSVDGGKPFLLVAGNSTQSIPLIPGERKISCKRLDGTGEAFTDVSVSAGENALLAVTPGSSSFDMISLKEGGSFHSNLDVDDAGEVTGRGRIRLVNRLNRTFTLAVHDDEVAVPPNENSEFLFLAGRLPGIIIGAELKRTLGVETGESVTVVSTLHSLSQDGGDDEIQGPIRGLFRVSGVFQSGYYEYDSAFSLVNFRASQRLLGQGDVVQWLEVGFDDVIQVKDRADAIEALLNPYGLETFGNSVNTSYDALQEDLALRALSEEKPEDVLGYLANVTVAMEVLQRQSRGFGYQPQYGTVDWEERNKNLFNALKLQKAMVTIFILLIIAVAAFNMVGSQIMMVHDKREEIAILKAMGASSKGIMTIFLIQGVAIAAVGTFVGLVMGVGACWLVDSVGYGLDPAVYFIDKLPVRLDATATILVGVMTLVFTSLSALYSARRASRLLPAHALRQLD